MTTVSPSLYARRGHQVWSAGTPWPSPSIGLGGHYIETVPPQVFGTSDWIASNGPGDQGQGCIDPGPNVGYSVSGGLLHLTSNAPGWSMISRQTFHRTKYWSLQWAMCGRLTSPVVDAFMGVGAYDGELDYRTLNLMRGSVPGWLDLALGSEPDHRFSTLVSDYTVENAWQAYRIDHEFNTWRYFADVAGEMMLLREETSPPLQHDFHVCIFIGGMAGSIGAMTANVE